MKEFIHKWSIGYSAQNGIKNKENMKQLFLCKFFSMHKLKDYDNYTISDIQGREIEKVIVKECEFCGELKIKRFSLLPIKDRSY